MCRARFLKDDSPVRTSIRSSVWHGIRPYYELVLQNTMWTIGKGESISYWKDNWLGVPLVEAMNIPPRTFKHLNSQVLEMIENFSWVIPSNIVERDPTLVAKIVSTVIPRQQYDDRLVWKKSKDGVLTSKQAYEFLFPPSADPSWYIQLWRPFIPPSCSFVVWRYLHYKMPTDENLRKRGCVTVSICVLCMSDYESTTHLFLTCPFAAALWNWLGICSWSSLTEQISYLYLRVAPIGVPR
jgi:hypothetical protein